MSYTIIEDVIILPDGTPATAIRYDNHIVSGDGFPAIELPFATFATSVAQQTQRFINLVQQANPSMPKNPIKTTISFEEKKIGTTYQLKTEAGSLEMRHTWDSLTDKIKVERPDSYAESWETWVCTFERIQQFVGFVNKLRSFGMV